MPKAIFYLLKGVYNPEELLKPCYVFIIGLRRLQSRLHLALWLARNEPRDPSGSPIMGLRSIV